MKIRLVFVPPGGGEADYSLEMDVPAIPKAGDYISVAREGNQGRTEDFIVRRTWWAFECGSEGQNGKATNIAVECEFAKSPYSSEDHVRACERYGASSFEETGY